MLKRSLAILASVFALLVASGASLMSGAQLSTAINWLLPEGWEVRLSQGLEPDWQSVALADFALSYQQCPLLRANGFKLEWLEKNRVQLDAATLDYACLEKLPSSNADGKTDTSLNGLLALIPFGEAKIARLEWVNLPEDLNPRLKGLLATPSQSEFAYFNDKLTARVSQAQLELSATLEALQLSAQLHYTPENEQHQLTLTSQLQDDLAQLPTALTLNYHWTLPKELLGADFAEGNATLNWQQQAGQFHGNFAYRSALNEKNRLDLPFTFQDQTLSVNQGQFGWDWLESFPLNGFINAQLMPNALNLQDFFPLKSYFRVSLLSQGKRGKGNIVIENKDGEWHADRLMLPLRLTGDVKYQDFILYSAVPLELQGAFDDLTLRFLPSSLLRLAGKEKYLDIKDLRFPLAGVRVNQYGISGRLQALFKGESPDFKGIDLHWDGYANNFKAGQLAFFRDPAEPSAPKDQWNWRFWGESMLDSLNAKVTINGRGNWHAKLVQLSEFKGTLANIQQPNFTLEPMELTLATPIQFAYEQNQLKGGLLLKSPKMGFRYGGELQKLQAKLNFNGAAENLNLQGEVNAGEIGPLRLFARRRLTAQASHFLGKIYWNEQPINVFQPLIPFRQNIVIKSGSVRGETAFSYNTTQGFQAGGHFAVRNGALSLPDGDIDGVAFSLPYQLKQGELDFGVKKPLEVKIRQVDLGVPIHNVSVKVNGHYPFSRKKPLYLSQLSFELLGGALAVDRFALPQTQIAYLRLQNIDLAQIFDTMQYRQIELAGRANAEFPFWLNGKPCYVCGGTLSQAGRSYLKFSPEFVVAMEQGGYTERTLLALINGSELSQLTGEIDVAENGEMQLAAKIKTELADQHHAKINLNYNHRENLFDLWQMINYGAQFEQQLEHNLYQKLDKR